MNHTVPTLALFLALACGSPDDGPENVSPPHCVDDGFMLAYAPCIVSCVTDKGYAKGYAFGTCDRPEDQRQCVTMYQGQTWPVVRQSNVGTSLDEDFEAMLCE
jgi:hypothetical protein